MKIKFCNKCDNMLYIHSTTNEAHLKYYCKNCDYCMFIQVFSLINDKTSRLFKRKKTLFLF